MEAIAIISAVGAAVKLAEELTDYVAKLRAAAQQSGEWTEAEEAAFVQLQKERAASPRWQPQGS